MEVQLHQTREAWLDCGPTHAHIAWCPANKFTAYGIFADFLSTLSYRKGGEGDRTTPSSTSIILSLAMK